MCHLSALSEPSNYCTSLRTWYVVCAVIAMSVHLSISLSVSMYRGMNGRMDPYYLRIGTFGSFMYVCTKYLEPEEWGVGWRLLDTGARPRSYLILVLGGLGDEPRDMV